MEAGAAGETPNFLHPEEPNGWKAETSRELENGTPRIPAGMERGELLWLPSWWQEVPQALRWGNWLNWSCEERPEKDAGAAPHGQHPTCLHRLPRPS